MKIYVVRGSTGEYSDRTEWLVRAFYNERQSKEFILELDELCRLLNIEGDKQVPNPNYDPTRKYSTELTSFKCTIKFQSLPNYIHLKKLDPKFYNDYTGTLYTYEEIELE